MSYCDNTEISTESLLRRRQFSCHSCQDSNQRSFAHKFTVIPLSCSHSPPCYLHLRVGVDQVLAFFVWDQDGTLTTQGHDLCSQCHCQPCLGQVCGKQIGLCTDIQYMLHLVIWYQSCGYIQFAMLSEPFAFVMQLLYCVCVCTHALVHTLTVQKIKETTALHVVAGISPCGPHMTV